MSQPKVFDCRNVNDQNDTAYAHRIEEDVFNEYLDNFWGHHNVISERRAAGFIQGIMLVHSCKKHKWAFDADETTDNNNIDIGFEDLPPQPITTNYSIALFKGIYNLDNPTDFHFYKARDNDGRFTVIFKVFCEDGTVRFYDLSNDFP